MPYSNSENSVEARWGNTEPSPAYALGREGVETMYGAPEEGEDIVRTARIHEGADTGRNDRWVRTVYAAGFFDGEGTVSIGCEHRTGNYSLRVSAGQLDRAPLELLKDLFGGSICLDRSGDKPMFKWNITAGTAKKALLEMLPYMIVKKEQTEIALEFHDGKATGWPRNKGVPQSEKQRGAEYLARLRAARF